MKILALDMATKTGWAYLKHGIIVESGTKDFTKKRGESNGLLFMKFRKWLTDLGYLYAPDVICYERAHFRGGAATELCVGLQTRAQEIAAENNCETLPVQTGQLKKFFAGHGKAEKVDMMKIAQKHIDRPLIDDNEADAIALALFAWKEVGQ